MAIETLSIRPLNYLYSHIKKPDQKLYDAFVHLETNAQKTAGTVNNIINNINNGQWKEEMPAGVVDGINTTYTLSHTPIYGSLTLFLNIVQREVINFTITGNIIVFTVAPKPRDVNPAEGPYFLARYQY